MTSVSVAVDGRKSVRVRTMLGAQIIFNNRASTIDCKVRNMSDAGAKILVDRTLTFPQQFEFMVPQKGRSYTARVIWRHLDEVGVAFLDQLIGASAVPMGRDGDMVGRLRELEAENALLKRKLADMKSRLDRYEEG